MDSFEHTQALPIISPQNMLPVKVLQRQLITPDTVNISIVLPGTTQAPAPYLPGQFVTLALPSSRETLYRSYSLCGDGDASQPWELTIKRVKMGSVSNYFYNSVQEGTLLYSSLPRGTFTLPNQVNRDMNFVFIAAGSGITPIYGMLRAITRMHPDDRPLVQLHYASRTVEDSIFLDELEIMDPREEWLRQYHYLSSEGDRMTVDSILKRTGKYVYWAHFYFCGPEDLKRELTLALKNLDISSDQIHSEVFATRQSQQSRPAYRLDGNPSVSNGGSVRIAETGAVLDVQQNETLLAALERQGYHPDFSCRAGACGNCKLKLLAGTVDSPGEALTPAERSDGFILSCIARPLGEITLASGGKRPPGVPIIDAAMSAIGKNSGQSTLVRIGSLAAVGMLVLGSWNLTNHAPPSWFKSSAAPSPPSSQQTPVILPTNTPASTAPTTTSVPVGQPVPTTPPITNAPTATPKPVSQPTATPKPVTAPTATPKPAPQPTATSTPSPPKP